ncbi:hypothetical protein [Nostoc sphaeroides]|nr:hypothetical protein [Nostoc sphaeroides]
MSYANTAKPDFVNPDRKISHNVLASWQTGVSNPELISTSTTS